MLQIRFQVGGNAPAIDFGLHELTLSRVAAGPRRGTFAGKVESLITRCGEIVRNMEM